ncbi:polysaccharide biosynthesis C-terminal domain-containing protein [Porphyromonadaceae bacterium W3.11]|nr:polysaccharide biosynthesis C-terminal domain-containing protein [Porphyromonadaceae bacterium W3.11]
MGVVFRQSAKGTIITLIGALIGFVSTFFIITKLLSPEEIGLTRVLVEAATMIGGFALLATQSSSVRYYPAFRTDDGKDGGFFKLLVTIPLVGFFLFACIYLIFKEPISNYFAASDGKESLFIKYYYLVIPLMLFIMYQTLMEVYCTLKQRVFIPKAIREVLLRLLLILCYLLYGLRHLSFTTFMGLFVAAYGIVAFLSYAYAIYLSPNTLKSKIQPIEPELKKDFTNYTLFTVLSALGGSIISRFDIFMVSSQMGLNFSGIYTIAFFIVAVIEMPSRSILAMTSPLVSDALYQGDLNKTEELFRKVSSQQLLIGSLLFMLIWLNIDFIFSIIPNSETYATGKWVVFFLGLAKLVDLSFNFGNAILRYSRYYPWTLAYTIIVMALTIVLNYYLIKRLGITGAAIATLITFVVSYAFQQIVIGAKLKIRVLNREMLWIILTLAVALALNNFLPSLHNLVLDAIYRSLICGVLSVALLYRLDSFQSILNEIKMIIRK